MTLSTKRNLSAPMNLSLQWIDQVLRNDDQPQDVQEIISRVYQVRSG